ncbi:sulfurtransferase [Parasphingorhabdus litoris]|uniref:Sulfurtransferase n=2 Tax=Parasphingorhabdus litoris TaxID=394733 RepID=A0ABN1A1C2_9SPHN
MEIAGKMANLDYANSKALIEPEELQAKLGNENLAIVEMDADDTEYQQTHIPGSIFWNVQEILDEDSVNLTDLAKIQRLLERSGLTPDTEIVVAHNSHRGTSGWVYWFFARLGHHKIRVLNGGKERWLLEKRPLTPDATIIGQGDYPVAQVSKAFSCSLSEVSDALLDDDTTLLDVRTKAEFDGSVYLNAPPKEGERAGHIPGAIHLHCDDVHKEDGSFLSRADILDLLKTIDIDGAKQVFPYCAIGARSAHMWFVLTQLLGWDRVRNFDGSWREWSSNPESPVK